MRKMNELFNLLDEREQQLCSHAPIGINHSDFIAFLILNHWDELTVEEYALLRQVEVDILRNEAICRLSED